MGAQQQRGSAGLCIRAAKKRIINCAQPQPRHAHVIRPTPASFKDSVYPGRNGMPNCVIPTDTCSRAEDQGAASVPCPILTALCGNPSEVGLLAE